MLFNFFILSLVTAHGEIDEFFIMHFLGSKIQKSFLGGKEAFKSIFLLQMFIIVNKWSPEVFFDANAYFGVQNRKKLKGAILSFLVIGSNLIHGKHGIQAGDMLSEFSHLWHLYLAIVY